MSPIEASTPKLTANISLIPDIPEELQLANSTNNYYSPPKNLLTTNETSSTNSSIELLSSNNQILDNSPETPPQQAEIDAFILNKDSTPTTNNIPEKPQTSTTQTDAITGDTAKPATQNNISFDSGIFQADETGKILFDYLSDGGRYQGELAIISLTGMQEFVPDSEAFIREAARRALSNSSLGYIAISDITEAAKFSSFEGENNFNIGEYRGIKTFAMTPGDELGIIVVPNGTIQEAYNNPAIGGDKKPLFSMATANSSDAFQRGQIAAVANGGSIFVMEDMGIGEGSEADYNDIIFSLKGATPKVISMDDLIAKNSDWRTSEKGKELIGDAAPKTETKLEDKKADTTSATNPVETKPENSPATETKNPTVSETPNSETNPVETKTENSPVIEDKQPTVSEISHSETNPVETKTENSPATETQNPTVSETPNSETNPVETKTENSPVIEDKQPPVSENIYFPKNPVETEIDFITGDTIEKPVFIQPEKLEIPVIPAESTDILTGEMENTSPTPIDSLENAGETADNLPLISPDEISTLWESLNSILAQQFPNIPETESSQNHQPSASEYSEYIVTDSQTIIPEIAVTENYDSQPSENITADSENQPPTTIGEFVNPDFEWENIAITPEILSDANNQPDNSLHIIPDSEIATTTDSNSEPTISEYTITDTETQPEITPNLPQQNQPLIGIIDTGFVANNPNIDYSQIILGKDLIDGDNNPLLQPNEGNQHGNTILDIINDSSNQSDTKKSTPIWLGRATGSGNWYQSLIEFVDAAKAAKQPNAVVNLSFDLTQINPDGTQTTRHKLTAEETAALKYAKDNNILIVAAAGNEGNLVSALGQASTEFDNIITVGASENNYRAGYSSYGEGLDILAPCDIPQTAEAATTETKQGTSIAAAKVTNTLSQMWAANPSLDYLQIKNILLNTAKDIDVPDWDERTGYGILNSESAIATSAETIPTIPVLAAAKLLTKPLIDVGANTSNSPNSTEAKPSERATATTAPGTPKTTSRSTGDYNVGTSSYTTDLAPYKTTSTSSSNGTTTTNSRILSSLSNTESSWDKSTTKTNHKGESFDESTSDSTTNAVTYTSKSFSQNSTENKNQWQENRSRVKYEGTRSDSSESAQKSRSSYDYTTPTYTRYDASESYRNSKSQSNSRYGTNLSIYNGNRQDDWGSKSTTNTRTTNGNNISTSKSATQTAGNAKWTNGSNGSSSNNTHSGEETTVSTSNSTNSNSSGFSKSSNSNDGYSVTNSTWDNNTINGVAINSNTRDVYSESSTNNQSSYDDGRSKNHSYQDTYTVNQSEQTNSSQGSSYRQNNRNNNYSVRQGNDTQTYKHGPQTSSRITDSYSVTKSDGYSANSSGKVTSKNNQESYSENFVQHDSEYKIDAYTTTTTGDEQTITSTRSNSSNDGTNNASSSSSDTVRTRNGQTVTVYKDGRKDETQTSSYERWWSDNSTDKGVTTYTSGSSTWSSTYRRTEFKGGYSWSETISGTDTESVTKGGVTTSKQTNWSWTRSGTVWDDGRNNWSESWSKSNWENGKSIPGESETARGSYDPKGTGTQTDNLPKAGEAPRLNKPPKNVVDLNKQPKYKPQPSQEFYEQPASYDKKFADNFPTEDPYAAVPPPASWPPKDIGSYWLSYTGTLKSSAERRKIFQDIIKNRSIQKVYMNALSVGGTTFSYGGGMPITGGDIFAEFKEELDRYNLAHPNNRRTIDVIGWFEGTGLAASTSPMYKAAQRANAVLGLKGDGGASYVDLVHPTVWGELQNIAKDFISKHGGLVKEIIFDDRLGIPKAAEADVINLHRATIATDGGPGGKSWIQRALTKNLTNLKNALPSTTFSFSGNLPAVAFEHQNQELAKWLADGIINGGYNLQFYKNGSNYPVFVNDYNTYVPQMLRLLNQNKNRFSVSIGYYAQKEYLKRQELIQQISFLRNNKVASLLPSQIIGFDYRTIRDIQQ
ncbi:peptidase S8 and S53 subtilisin kexin sedolisin [Oscillatoria nigro-viridis PCC 7112]|uniref:Peptidase S8 and S53 subtilisin kexin sedolisin n=1 Tax=Phormidium nigroviride PCC 7112 TaxID=179408 RepID=K9VAR9_9CYAN|nr:S8 family serine peptidase [Oscillatoria nigro-viridis]AFZ04941.1 peptidase S8 and S53 subtilisin kexin sedolisin [Oscillatoria nigro-viridis PCC 7112]